MRPIATSACAALLALGLSAGPAAAAECAPPGNSAVDQYLETVPCSDDEPGGEGGSVPESPTAPGDPGASGAEGTEAAAVPEAAAPDEPAPRKAAKRKRRERADTTPPGLSQSAGALSGTLTGGSDGGMGAALPILLGATLLGSVGLAVRRARADRAG